MVNFLDGPAAGKRLALKRIPILLRVVQSANGEWDALDQISDTPRPGEKIFVYRRRDDHPIQKYHLYCARGRGSGWYWEAWYSVLPEQPGDEHVRETKAWQEWATAHVETVQS